MLSSDWLPEVIMVQNFQYLTKSRYLPGLSLFSLVAVAAVIRNSHLIGVIPGCPIKALIGIDCPACGSVRCVEALANGQVGHALDQNLLTTMLFAYVTIFMVLWLVLGPNFMRKIDIHRVLQAVAGVALIFWVSRLTPWEVGEWLSSGIYHE